MRNAFRHNSRIHLLIKTQNIVGKDDEVLQLLNAMIQEQEGELLQSITFS